MIVNWQEMLDGTVNGLFQHRARDEVVSRWGEYVYRRFRIYLWGCVHYFTSGTVTAYRLLMQLPAQPGSHPAQAHQSTREPPVTAGMSR